MGRLLDNKTASYWNIMLERNEQLNQSGKNIRMYHLIKKRKRIVLEVN